MKILIEKLVMDINRKFILRNKVKLYVNKMIKFSSNHRNAN